MLLVVNFTRVSFFFFFAAAQKHRLGDINYYSNDYTQLSVVKINTRFYLFKLLQNVSAHPVL